MNSTIKYLLLLTTIGLPVIDSISNGSLWSQAASLAHRPATGSSNIRGKDGACLFPTDDLGNPQDNLARTSPETACAADAVHTVQAFGLPYVFRGPPPTRDPLALPSPHMRMRLPLPTKPSCEDHIDVTIALTAYVKAKLRLQPFQRQAWETLESAAESAIDKVRAACAGFPANASVNASLPELLDAMEADMSARAGFLRATREPMRSLFALLTPEQRMLAEPLLRPPH